MTGQETTADVYCSTKVIDPCQRSGGRDGEGAPVVLLYPGGTGPKEEFSSLATSLAASGHTVMVLQQLFTIEGAMPPVPTTPINAITASATGPALAWLRDAARGSSGSGGYGGTSALEGCAAPVDVESVTLVGHSLGAVSAKQVLAEYDPGSTFINTGPVELPYYEEIVGAFLFGYAEGTIPGSDFNVPDSVFLERIAARGQPIFVANGDLDRVADVTVDGFGDSINENDAYLVLSDLDHFSNADSVFLVRDFDVYSTRPRTEQLAIVADVAVAALSAMLCGEGPGGDITSEYVVQSFGDDATLDAWLSWLNA